MFQNENKFDRVVHEYNNNGRNFIAMILLK